ncbi:MAG: hypothetical protein HY422_01505 [Candidatus Komeilibacteria bacterium]|nr:hypothetical protein [Candidatus Komeilibacteria bacterium]
MRLNVGLMVLLVISSVGNLIVSNHGANQRYAFSKSMAEYRALQSEHQKLLNRVAELQSPNRLITESERLQLVNAADIAYVTTGGAVALNR